MRHYDNNCQLIYLYENLKLSRDSKKDGRTDYGFVTYSSKDEAEKALNEFDSSRYFQTKLTLEYAKKLYNWANDIKKSGSNYTDNVAHIRSRYMHWYDKEYKWKNKDKAFANMIVEFKVKALVPLEYGSKITGRWAES